MLTITAQLLTNNTEVLRHNNNN